MRGWQGSGSVGRLGAKRAKRVAAETREGWVTEEWRGRGREGRMKGPTGTGSRRGPTWSRHSAVSHWHLNLRWPGRDCLSGTGDITRGADLWPTTSSSPPQQSPHLLRQPFTSFSVLMSFQLLPLRPSWETVTQTVWMVICYYYYTYLSLSLS